MDLLIGHTGFVGSTLARARDFDRTVNSTTINEIRGQTFDLVVNCGVPAEKWRANKEPDQDRANIASLMEVLSTISARRFVQISTIDVFKTPVNVDETTDPIQQGLHAYGLHRLELERFIATDFPKVTTLRLPGLFGRGLKKNIIFDLMHQRLLENINPNSAFQWYPLDRLAEDMARAVSNDLSLLHLAPEPLATEELVERVFKGSPIGAPEGLAPRYDFRTCHDALFERTDGYIMGKEEVIAALQTFVADEAGIT
ncbi:sugar nucleotide-binding protein [Tritonibacter horizontis]|uniref:RmlD substrate binding domain protein n=1 Tax=Tritonibacter horizontis TaxID=1768241 RepID=A0A132C210_9RHOB|nr:sugar nucleotide-binding protein [Tritonibacter horizontis]KUP94613.1 RmlD substrate binding domain protein [Tritonibacter horizontis]